MAEDSLQKRPMVEDVFLKEYNTYSTLRICSE
jgi:hypothetical protein